MPWARPLHWGTGAVKSDIRDDWRYAATVYLWNSGIDGQSAAGSGVDVSFQSFRAKLNLAFLGALDA